VTGWEDSPPRLLPFATEEDAVEHAAAFLRPVCTKLVREPVLKSGLRPDIGFRLSSAPSVPLVLECKKFEPGKVSALIDAIRQAHSYTQDTGHIAVVGPIEARGPTHLAWYSSAIGAIGLVAGEFSVGYLYHDPQGGGGICIGGQALARFRPLPDGSFETTPHSNASALFVRKHFSGSSTWRKAS